MTKICGDKTDKKPEKQISNENKEIDIVTSTATTQKKSTKKTKRKNSIAASRSNGNCVGKKKQALGGRRAYHSTSSLSILHTKLSTNLARLAPLLINRSCPNDLLQIESVKSNSQSNITKESKSSHCAAVITPLKNQDSLKKLKLLEKLRINRNLKKIDSRNCVTQGGAVTRNYSSPNLVVTTKNKGFDSGLPQSQTYSSDASNILEFYQDDANFTIANKISLNPHRQRTFKSRPHPFLNTLRQDRRVFTPNSRQSIGLTNFLSAPSTPFSSVSGKARKEKSTPILRAAGWNCLKGLTTTYLASVAFDSEEGSDVFSEAAASLNNRVDDKLKLYNFNTLKFITSIKKAMNAKSNSQISVNANPKNSQPQLQYQTGHRPRIANNFSSSFILPYGLGSRMQSSPVTSSAVPNSSSFHGGPLESLQLMSENHQRATRQQCNSGQQQQQRQQRKYLERQKMKMLKPLGVNKNQGNITKLYDISTSEFSAAILPDPGTSSYRMTHDVSFDEGSRYRTNDYPHNFKGKDDMRIHPNYNGLMSQFGSTSTNESHAPASHNRHEGRIIVSREHMTNHSNNNNISFKESVPLSLIRMDERFAADLPPASPSSPAMSSAIAATTSSSFIPPPSASRQNPPHITASTGSNITFRLHKEKHNWNYRLGELSINGGGLYTPSAVNSSARPDLDSMSLNMASVNATSQRNSLTRERVAIPPKSRMSSRYASKGDSANAAASFSDPCISAPPSFQQRLTDLSLLESDTIKYERNRKLRRKKNQDKDS